MKFNPQEGHNYDQVGMYSIKDLERLSGIKAHTIRIWEQRYGILAPERTDTNIRYYSDDDLRKLLNIAMLNRQGMKISRIAGLPDPVIQAKVMELMEGKEELDIQIDSLVVAMIGLDEQKFERILSRNVIQSGFEETMVSLIYPFLEKVGLLWQTAAISPAHEHFISNLIRQKIIVALDGQDPVTQKNAEKFMLFLPEGELHEIALLFAAYLLKKRGKKVIFLGQSLPMNDLKLIYKAYHPENLFTISTSYPEAASFSEWMKELAESFPECRIFISGHRVKQVPKLPSHVIRVDDVHHFLKVIDQ